MSSQGTKGVIVVWMAVALVASVTILVKKAYADIKTIGGIQAFKILMDPLPGFPEGAVEFKVPLSEPVNCKCSTNEPVFADHGVGEVALTVDDFPAPPLGPGGRISYTATDFDGAQRAGIFCPTISAPPTVIGFLTGPSCAGGVGADNVPSILGAAKPGGGDHLVECCTDAGWFIATTATPGVLVAHSHIGPVKARVFCWFRK